MAVEKPTPYQLGQFIMETLECFKDRVPNKNLYSAIGRAVIIRYMTEDIVLSEENAARRARDYKRRRKEAALVQGVGPTEE